MGWSVACAGDVNDDGFDDLLAGAPYGDWCSPDAGYVCVYSGSGGEALDISCSGLAGDNFGMSVSGVGDIYADCNPDYLVGAPGADSTGRTDAGAVWVYPNYFGVLGRNAGDDLGRSVATVADLTGQGVSYIVAGGALADPGGRTDAGRVLILGRQFCNCACHADPVCDGVTNVQDVVATRNVAFGGADPIVDPTCTHSPGGRTDVDCSGYTDVFDLTRVVQVAFRGGDPDVWFCKPCNCDPYPSNCPW
jgi:hypothetical protein